MPGNRGSYAVAEKYVRKFPKANSQTIARILVKKEPLEFVSLEHARLAVRYLRGAQGKKHRHKQKVPGSPFHEKKPTMKHTLTVVDLAPDPLMEIPEPLSKATDWKPYRIFGEARIGMLQDVHVPFHDKAALIAAIAYLRDYKPTHIILNGDFCDFHAISKYRKRPKECDFPGELAQIKQVFEILRKVFPTEKIIFKNGNHEDRYEIYMIDHAPEIFDMEQFTLKSLLELDKYGFEHVDDAKIIQVGPFFNIIHGHEFGNISTQVNVARTLFLRAKTNCAMSHLHRTSENTETTMDGKLISTWSTGCLCDLKPRYRRLNSWNHGFMTVDLAADGQFTVQNRRIIKGKIF